MIKLAKLMEIVLDPLLRLSHQYKVKQKIEHTSFCRSTEDAT